MKRKFLEDLGLEDSVIDSVMAEHGKTLNTTKDDLKTITTERDELKTQIKERDEQLEDLSDKAKDHEALTEQINALKKTNEDSKKAYEEKIKKQAFDFTLDKVLIESKARNPVAVKALLDLETIKLGEDGNLIGLQEQLDAKKESDWYLFENDDDKNTTPPPSNTHIAGSTKKTNSPKDKDPYEQGRLKAQERFKKEEAQ